LASRPSSLQVFSYFIGQELERNKPPELYLLGLVDNTHSPTAEFLNGAVVRFGPPNTGGESYLCETGKSMKRGKLAASQYDSCCNVIYCTR
jgi:hypothetical protein